VQVARARLLSCIWRPVAATAALAALLGLHPGPARLVQAASAQGVPAANTARTLIVSDQARRYLALQYRSYPTEFLGCMIGEVRGQTIFVDRIAPADVDPSQSTATFVVPKHTCEDAGWAGTVGMVHSHPSGDRCWYSFPGTQVPSSDGQSFLRRPYPVDAIVCGDRVVWTGRDLVQREVALALAGQGFTPSTASR
jgi:proteasome lid subunit RPN8/RPN11